MCCAVTLVISTAAPPPLLWLRRYAPGFHKESATIGAAWGSFKPLPPYQATRPGSAAAPPGKGPTPLGATVRRPGASSSDLAGPAPLPPSYAKASVEQRRVAELLAAELAEVARLTPAATGDGSSWEERTGYMTVPKGPG